MPDILSLLSIAFLPLLITIILVWGIWKKVPIYDTFIKGAKDGLKTSVEILPFLLGIFLAIGALTSSGAMGFLQETTRPFFEKIGIPQELISLILLLSRSWKSPGPTPLQEELPPSWSEAAKQYSTSSLCILASLP